MNSYGNEFSLVGVPCSLALFIWFFYKWRYCPQADNGDVMYPGSAVLLCSGVLAFVTSVAWMNIQANEVVALLETIGIVFDVNIAVLGVTVLAIGNSVGDWVADTTVARKGKPAMGFSSCFGSPLLNDVLGLGISLTAYTAKHFPHPFQFDVKSSHFKTVIFCWIMLVLTLGVHAVVFPLSRFTPPK
jgi:sodium/potassium/calcium exchanger 6